ncbi:MAG: glycerol-3-phosphate dehydrogenase/oxidase [Actinobacteria bacterium]|jgi:glycerol-3-phosphate dehydrogenase|nr:glycerol-3-phosphate dehydrogenase/oxidase [Actinomycetota bacterium]
MISHAFNRSDALRRLESTDFDVVVIGGGITGVGCALDAASRGLRVALIERDDFASGTSSKSSKLVHGGIRYLQQGDIRLVYEALAERQILRRNAPHLVKVLPFLIPIFSTKGVVNRKLARAMGTAMWMYDLTGGLRIGKMHKRVSKKQALEWFPTLPADKLMPSYLYYDAEADDARLVVTVARTAALRFDATLVNRTEVVDLQKDSNGNVNGVTVKADGRTFTVSTKAVVNAAGVWSDDVRALDEAEHPRSIRPAKGVHITVPWSKVRNTVAAVIPVPGDKRSVFVVPWGQFTFVGTTDTDYTGPIDDPQCNENDVEYLLRALNGSITETVTTDDILGTWAGLRPLVADPEASGRTADLSRRHKVRRSDSGVVTITGGKLTTYREMAADTIDEVLSEVLDADRITRFRRRSKTKHIKIHGANGYEDLVDSADTISPLGGDQVRRLADRYGSDATTVLAIAESDQSLAEPLVPGLHYLRAEAIFAVRYEMATTVDDILSRRTRARLETRDASADAAAAVAALLAPELGWDEAEQARQVADYRARIDEELEAIVH